MSNKRGMYWGILLTLILSIILMGIIFYWIYGEYFNANDYNWDSCRTSIQLRSSLPDISIAHTSWKSFKDDFPLKCKTQVVDITKADLHKDKNGDMNAEKIIAENMAKCWALFDSGDSNAFPSESWFSISSFCVPCARIHLTEDAKKEMISKNIKIDIQNASSLRMTDKYSYYVYLQNSGKKFPALDFASSRPFDLAGDNFSIDEDNKIPADFKNRLTGKEDKSDSHMGYVSTTVKKVSLPRFFNSSNGDLLINYGVIVSSKKGEIGSYIPYLFYFQDNQKVNPFEESKKVVVDGMLYKNAKFCGQWEGILA